MENPPKQEITKTPEMPTEFKAEKTEAEIRSENIKFQQSKILEWADKMGLKEGRDFIFINVNNPATIPGYNPEQAQGEKFVPHEISNLYLAFRKEHFKIFTQYFSEIYNLDMKPIKKSWSSEAKLNYSWAGRYMVHGAGGTAIDTCPINNFENLEVQTHHQEFKNFFKQKTGKDLPPADVLNEIIEKMSDSLNWYELALEKCREKQKISAEPWIYDNKINNLVYMIDIIKDGKTLKQIPTSNEVKIQELPESFTGYLNRKIRHYNDLTYNLDDWENLDEIASLIGVQPPQGKFQRIDRIPEDYYNNVLDRKIMEDLCRQFSEKLYGKTPKSETK